MAQAKTCIKCEIEKSLEEFKWRSDTQKYRNACNLCRAPGLRAAVDRYQAKNPEKILERAKQYALDHPEIVLANQQRRQESGRMREASYRWRALNPEAWLQVGHRYRARLRAVTYENTAEYRSILEHDPCSYCGGPTDTIDHIEALIVGGTETEDNLTAACRSCNSRKRERSLLLWMAIR